MIFLFEITVVATLHGRDNVEYSLLKCRVRTLVKALALCVEANLRVRIPLLLIPNYLSSIANLFTMTSLFNMI